MSHMGRAVCIADPPPCFADSMAPRTSLAMSTVSLALVANTPPERRWHGSPNKEALSAHRAFVRETLALPRVRWVRTVGDLMSLSPGNLGVLFGTQYVPNGLTEHAVREWRAARLQSMAPFAAASEYGGWIRDSYGLTERGRQLIEWIGRHGLVLDLSKASRRTVREALAFIRQNKLSIQLMASNSGCFSIFPHTTNLQDDMLREIADLGGYVGIPIRASLLAEESRDIFRALVLHVSHASKVCGSDAIGIGSSVMVDFKALERKLQLTLGRSAVEGYIGRNFESFLFRSLP